ncbi:hypothetical protein [Nocardia macrotermitis]|uniref:Uncharacterized protein n=1 Tax=Nocardia macrotermitis TaxID=2585198 RepID=A0A7K0D477_9NOCA|nr:hypothetical protein [Nocardia macrotermitis]MQY20391.1 hypothetical protein [Nocardia macrotermitis]
MRARTVVMATVATAAGITAGLAGAGSAAAVTPLTLPHGGVGVALDHGETQTFANGPIPALIDQALPADAIAVGIGRGSQLPRSGNHVRADLPSIVTEAANQPNGRIALLVRGPELTVVQLW